METKFEVINTEKQIHRAETSREMMNYVQESDYHTKENNKTFVCESCKTNENEILNQYKKLKEEVLKGFAVSELTSSLKHYRQRLKEEADSQGL